MGKIRVYKLAAELNVSSQEILDYLKIHGYTVNSHKSEIGSHIISDIKNNYKRRSSTVMKSKGIEVCPKCRAVLKKGNIVSKHQQNFCNNCGFKLNKNDNNMQIDELVNNPYRILGLLGGASERTIRRNISKIEAYTRVGKKITFETDLDFLTPLQRNEDKISNSKALLEQNDNRLFYSLFWFVSSNHIDETAINHLKSGNIEKAFDIWNKVTSDGKMTPYNVSAWNNSGTLNLIMGIYNNNRSQIVSGIKSKIKLLGSESAIDYATMVTDKTYQYETNKHLVKYIKLIQSYKTVENNPLNNIEFGEYGDAIPEEVISSLVENPISSIDHIIEKTRKNSTTDPSKGYDAGIQLIRDSEKYLKKLVEILDVRDYRYIAMRNGIAKEASLCAMDYYKYCCDNGEFKGNNKVTYLLDEASKLALDDEIIKKNDDYIENIKEGEKYQPIVNEMNSIYEKIDEIARYKSISNIRTGYTIQDAKDIYNHCEPLLLTIKNKMGGNNSIYLKISDDVLLITQNILVEYYNDAFKRFDYMEITPQRLAIIIYDVYDMMLQLDTLDMSSEARGKYIQNRNTIKSQYDAITGRAYSRQGSGEYCYIATMAYGSYNHPQVFKLRLFRDNVLASTKCGRFCIKLYYKVSPHIVHIFKYSPKIHQIIRYLLDKFIKKYGMTW